MFRSILTQLKGKNFTRRWDRTLRVLRTGKVGERHRGRQGKDVKERGIRGFLYIGIPDRQGETSFHENSSGRHSKRVKR